MKRRLTAQERKGLHAISTLGEKSHPASKGDLLGIGQKTLDTLVELGLAKFVRTVGRTEGYLVTERGERVMYGKTMQEMLASDEKHKPLPVWEVEIED